MRETAESIGLTVQMAYGSQRRVEWRVSFATRLNGADQWTEAVRDFTSTDAERLARALAASINEAAAERPPTITRATLARRIIWESPWEVQAVEG